ncbi:MAG: HK97 family phage prohead protease [Muribaculaceae bacterium]|nr:HK97 family phage prohead protease [Muribaculaceae bacterium]
MKQTRFIPIDECNLQVREDANGQPSRTVVGHPIVYGVRSVNLIPWNDKRVVYEVLEPGCISPDVFNRSDVIYNNNHSTRIEDMLGRCYKGKGTLQMTPNERNVEIRCDYPNTTTANDTLEQIRLGNVFGMSFSFRDDWEDTENGVSYERTNETIDGKEVWIRHVKRIVELYDVANVTHPAYEQTDVATREQSEAIDKAIEAQMKRECGNDEDKKKAEEEEADNRDCGGKDDKRDCGGKDDKRDDDIDDDDKCDPDDHNDPDDKCKTDDEQEVRELEEQAERFREQRAMRLRAQHLRCEIDFESLEY